MHPASEPASPSRSNVGATYLNGVIWGIIVVGALAVAGTLGSPTALVPLLVVFLVASLGLVANLGLFLWKLATGRFHQAIGYGSGFMLLAVVVFGLLEAFYNVPIGKIGG
ncbi:MAG: hypothetical protein ACRYG7_32240 [Janthinobacterium lividum]